MIFGGKVTIDGNDIRYYSQSLRRQIAFARRMCLVSSYDCENIGMAILELLIRKLLRLQKSAGS